MSFKWRQLLWMTIKAISKKVIQFSIVIFSPRVNWLQKGSGTNKSPAVGQLVASWESGWEWGSLVLTRIHCPSVHWPSPVCGVNRWTPLMQCISFEFVWIWFLFEISKMELSRKKYSPITRKHWIAYKKLPIKKLPTFNLKSLFGQPQFGKVTSKWTRQ